MSQLLGAAGRSLARPQRCVVDCTSQYQHTPDNVSCNAPSCLLSLLPPGRLCHTLR